METRVQLFHFYVDAKRFESEKHDLKGTEIKHVAGIAPNYQLFLEEEGDKPDKLIKDDETVSINVDEKHTRHFFAVPPATFGMR